VTNHRFSILFNENNSAGGDNFDDYNAFYDDKTHGMLDSIYEGNFHHDDYTDGGNDDDIVTWEWETHKQISHIYLPPPSTNVTSTPKTIVHFIGGTLFGSYPIQFYSALLEKIAERSNSIIVATSIPVNFQSNPLNHDRLCFIIARSFRDAYRNVICNEFGTKDSNNMNIIGLGHSLGSRLHCILSSKSSLIKIAYPRAGNVLIAFNNYNAITSVPGVKSLEQNVRESQMQDQERKRKERIEKERRQDINGKRSGMNFFQEDDDYDNTRMENRKTRENNWKRSDNSDYDRYYYDEDYDIDFEDIVTVVRDRIEDKLSSIRDILTPDFTKGSFEFRPTPEELWSQIQEGEYRRNVASSLLVQFDGDRIDQSARLARSILASSASCTKNIGEKCDNDSDDGIATEKDDAAISEIDIKFARLRGTHLTPVSYADSFGVIKSWERISSLPMDVVLEEALGEEEWQSKRRSKRRKNKDLSELVGSIVQYIARLNENINLG